MRRPDPLQAGNRCVRDFAETNRLRTEVRDDGEVVVCVGPRRPRPQRLGLDGAAFVSDSHAGFGQRSDVWTVFVGLTTPRRVAAVAAIWRARGLSPHVLDFETWTDVSEERLLEVLDACSATRPRRRRRLSPEQRSLAAARLAAHRLPALAPRPPSNGGSAAENHADGAGPGSEPSVVFRGKFPPEPPVLGEEAARRP